METIMILKSDDSAFIEALAEKISEKVFSKLHEESNKSKPEEIIYLTRKATAKKLKVSPPTVDQFVIDGLLTKLGSGKRTRFRIKEVDNLYENIDKYYYRPRKKQI